MRPGQPRDPGRPGLTSASLAGAVDLSSLAPPPPAPEAVPAADDAAAAPPAGGGAPAGTIIDVTEQTFATEVAERSRQVPVVIDFWASWCGPCRQLSPVLEKLAAEGNGSWVLAKIDVDANQQLAASAGVQSIPAVKAVVDGQIVGEFNGVVPEPQLRQWIASLLETAAPSGAEADQARSALAEQVGQAEDALRRGDLDAAEKIFTDMDAETPGDPVASAGLAQVALVRRISVVQDPEAAIAAADAAPADVAAQTLAADVEVASGRTEAALARLVATVRRTAGEDRDRVREHLLGLFAILSPEDPAVITARRDLTRALF